MPMEMMAGSPTGMGRNEGNMSPEMMAEYKAEKEEQRDREVISDAMYALNNIQRLMVLDADRIQKNPKMIEVLTKLREGIDGLIAGQTTPDLENPSEPEAETPAPEAEEEEPDINAVPINDRTAGLNMARKMGFGSRPQRGY